MPFATPEINSGKSVALSLQRRQYASASQSGDHMTRSAPPIHDIAAFIAVAQHASFTRAAERLETSKSNVGKAVQRLEDRLGTKLFQRTTRTVRLTEDGETYL